MEGRYVYSLSSIPRRASPCMDLLLSTDLAVTGTRYEFTKCFILVAENHSVLAPVVSLQSIPLQSWKLARQTERGLVSSAVWMESRSLRPFEDLVTIFSGLKVPADILLRSSDDQRKLERLTEPFERTPTCSHRTTCPWRKQR